jgi:hypothetical protein
MIRAGLLGAGVLVATVGASPITPPPVHQGSQCFFGPFRSATIGAVQSGAPDTPGPRGNEVYDVYRVFFVTVERANPVSGFAGFLTMSFDGRTSFMPASLPTAEGVQSWVFEDVVDPAHLPLGSWLRIVADHWGRHDPSLDVLFTEPVATAVTPCFAGPWDGVHP